MKSIEGKRRFGKSVSQIKERLIPRRQSNIPESPNSRQRSFELMIREPELSGYQLDAQRLANTRGISDGEALIEIFASIGEEPVAIPPPTRHLPITGSKNGRQTYRGSDGKEYYVTGE